MTDTSSLIRCSLLMMQHEVPDRLSVEMHRLLRDENPSGKGIRSLPARAIRKISRRLYFRTSVDTHELSKILNTLQPMSIAIV